MIFLSAEQLGKLMFDWELRDENLMVILKEAGLTELISKATWENLDNTSRELYVRWAERVIAGAEALPDIQVV